MNFHDLPKDMLVKLILTINEQHDVEKMDEKNLRELKLKVDNQLLKLQKDRNTWEIFIMDKNNNFKARIINKPEKYSGKVSEIINVVVSSLKDVRVFDRYNNEISLDDKASNYTYFQVWPNNFSKF